jgi:hypothetical protein
MNRAQACEQEEITKAQKQQALAIITALTTEPAESRYEAILKLIERPIAQGLRLLDKGDENDDCKQILDKLKECKVAHTITTNKIRRFLGEIEKPPAQHGGIVDNSLMECYRREQAANAEISEMPAVGTTKAILHSIQSSMGEITPEDNTSQPKECDEQARVSGVRKWLRHQACRLETALAQEEKDQVAHAIRLSRLGSVFVAAAGGGAGAAEDGGAAAAAGGGAGAAAQPLRSIKEREADLADAIKAWQEDGGIGGAPPRPSGSPHHCSSAAYGGGEIYGGGAGAEPPQRQSEPTEDEQIAAAIQLSLA